MNQAGMILALILLSIPAEMVKGSKPSKRSKPSKPSKPSKSSQYNTVQYNSVQYNTVQYNYEGVSDKGPLLPAWLPGRKRKPSPAWRGWHGEAVTGVEGTPERKKRTQMNGKVRRCCH